jgi:hypothetical protein
MRCRACDIELTDKEATRKCPGSGEFLDLCNNCYEAGYDSDMEEDVFEAYDGELFRVLGDGDYYD